MKKKAVAAGPFIGEFGWELMGFSGIVRNLHEQEVYKDHDFIVMTQPGRYPIYHEFADKIVPLPSWFTGLGLESASYDAVGITPTIYGDLLKYFRRFYYDFYDEIYELRPPRGHTHDFMSSQQQAWIKLKASPVGNEIRDNLVGKNYNGNLLVVMPRYRVGVTQGGNEEFSLARNWPPEYWQEVINRLSNDGFTLVIAGVKNGLPPINYNLPNVINLSQLDPMYVLDATLAFMDIAIGNICSVSGGTHLGLQACCPTWILGHERHRHTVQCNPLQTACMFLETDLPYSNIDPNKAYLSIHEFIDLILKNIHDKRMEALNSKTTVKDNNVECSICGSMNKGVRIKDLSYCGDCTNFSKMELPAKASILNALKNMQLSYMFDDNKLEERTNEAVMQLTHLKKFSKTGKLYDVGCGNGAFMHVARETGWEVEGNEVSQFAVNSGKSKYGLDLQYGMLEDQINTKDFDAFVLWHTLEHTLNPKETLNYCKDHLKVGGIVQIAVPIKSNDELAGDRYENLHFYEFSVAGLRKLVESCGFEVVYDEMRSPNNDTQVHMIGRKI